MLIPKICVIQNGCSSFYVFDKTGEYDATDNPGGYGAPNPPLGDVQAAVLSIIYAGATQQIDIDVFPLLPTLDEDAAYEVTAAACGLTTFPAGLVRVTLTLTMTLDATPTHTASVLVLFDCEYACCVDKKFRDLALDKGCCDGCNDSKVTDALYLEAILEATRRAACCGDIDTVTKNLEILKTKCSATGCGGC